MYVRSTELPYLLFIPEKLDESRRLIVESSNCESNERDRVLKQAVGPLKECYQIFNGSSIKGGVPVMVPLIPSTGPSTPYYQQLSPDMFYEREYQDIPGKTDRCIDDALNKIEEKRGVKLDKKVFMKGYSASGEFAQRFALFHPERIDTLCVGGASGSMPLPVDTLEYPLEVGGLPNFDKDAYLGIKFRYYVGEYELLDMASNDREDVIDGKLTKVTKPMHDMTYFNRSMNPMTGYKYRSVIGEDYFERVERLLKIYQELGCDIESTIVPGRAHMNINVDGVEYKAVAEKAAPIIDRAYKDSIKELEQSKKI